MRLSDFIVGNYFECAGNVFKCTDIGSRVVVAIKRRDGWENGPPYALGETVFDEDDQKACDAHNGEVTGAKQA